MIETSVIICSHNPREDYFARCVQALREQDADLDSWELILIDNASDCPLAGQVDLTWHPHSKIMREEELGIAPARIRGMGAARADTILFVDDDNVLASDYLRLGQELGRAHPDFGCWGGQLLAEFEERPPEWSRQWWPYLAIRTLDTALVAKGPTDYPAIPPTAGEFIRRCVWEKYLALIREDPRHLWLGLRGNQRISGQDTDIALCAFDVGLTTARFPELSLVHIMPRRRLEVNNLAHLIESISFSTVILEGLRDNLRGRKQSISGYVWDRFRALRLPQPHRAFFRAQIRGRFRAHRKLASTSRPSSRV